MNDTIKHQINHRSIRKFKDIPLTELQLDAILDAASHTPTYTFLQAASIIGVTDKKTQKPSLIFVNNLMWQNAVISLLSLPISIAMCKLQKHKE